MAINLAHLEIAHLPTPIEPLSRLSATLGGVQLWVKRDDLTGLAFGGNKTRKLEYLLAEAQSLKAKSLITRGAVQSNHCRQTAAAAARFGFDCILVLSSEPPDKVTSNLLLDYLLGAEIVWTKGRNPDEVLEETIDKARVDGRQPYEIPYGGSNPLGASSYAAAMAEFLKQDLPVDRIVLATSSGGTQAGLLVGARMYGFKGKILGISVDKTTVVMQDTIADLAEKIADLLQDPMKFSADEVLVNDDYLGGGYGVFSSFEDQAIKVFARKESLLLDPVYTARAAGGILDLIHKGAFCKDERILFWHTGGTPGLFAYASNLAPDPAAI